MGLVGVVVVTDKLLLLEPAEFVTVNVTAKDPALLKVLLGFCEVLEVPSPKFQDQLVGEPVEESVKLTAKGA